MRSYLSIFKANTILFLITCIFIVTNLSSKVNAQEEEALAPAYAYIALDPDIVTNYIGDNSKRLGYLRLSIELLLDNPNFIMYVEQHMPLLRATAIEIIGAQSEQNIRSLTGREDIRRAILRRFRSIMLKEAGDQVVKDIIFTKYLRQG